MTEVSTGESLSEAFSVELRGCAINIDQRTWSRPRYTINMSSKFLEVPIRFREIYPWYVMVFYKAVSSHCDPKTINVGKGFGINISTNELNG